MSAKSARRKITRHERRVATALGGRKTFASGMGDEKGDGRVSQRFTRTAEGIRPTVKYPLRIENKFTSTPSYTLTGMDWFKLRDAAIRESEHPIFHITLTVAGIGKVELAVLEGGLANELGLNVSDKWAMIRPWPLSGPAKSFTISWNRWHGGPPMGLVFQRPAGTGPLAHLAHLRKPEEAHLLLVDHLDLSRALKEKS